MKKINWIFGLLLLVMTISFSSCSRVDAGYVGIKVNLLGSDKGVQSQVLSVGRYWIGMNEQLYLFPTYQVNYVYTRESNEGSPDNEEFSFQTTEGMICYADLGLSMHFDVDKITDMFQKYRKGEEEIRGIIVRKEMRDALQRVAGTMPIEYVYGVGKGKLIDSVKSIVKNKLAPTGIIVDDINLIGAIRIPPSIEQSLNDKVKMSQDAMKTQNQLADEIAKANIKKAKADGEAYYNRTVSASLTPALIELRKIEKWNGVNSSTILGGGSNTMVNLR
jgi:hypothetical protein